jgi:hypothetical protein
MKTEEIARIADLNAQDEDPTHDQKNHSGLSKALARHQASHLPTPQK